MAEKTYVVSESGTYKVRALGTNNRYADSNEVDVTIANVRDAGFFISGDGKNLIAVWDITGSPYDNRSTPKTVTINGNIEGESYSVPADNIDTNAIILDATVKTTVTATVPLSTLRGALTSSTSIENAALVWQDNGIIGDDGVTTNAWKPELSIASATYDVVTDTIKVTLTAEDPTPVTVGSFKFSDLPDGSFTFKFGDKEGIIGDRASAGTVNITNATSKVGADKLNSALQLSLTEYTPSEEDYGLYAISAENGVELTVKSIAKPVLTYDASTKTLKWETVEGATSYEVYKGDSKVTTVT